MRTYAQDAIVTCKPLLISIPIHSDSFPFPAYSIYPAKRQASAWHLHSRSALINTGSLFQTPIHLVQ
jgi:hypothetical protein